MSSRSFRRRNSRRRRRQGAPGEGGAGAPGVPPLDGARDSTGADTPGGPQAGRDGSGGAGGPGGSAPGNGQFGQPRGGRQDGRGQDGRRQGGRQPGGRPQGGGRSTHGRGGPGGPPREAPREPPARTEPAVPIVLPDCPVCGKQVRELASALTHRVSRQPAHFDCVVRELRESNEVAPEEKICYLGGGTFGILEFRPSSGSPRFVIKKRIPYEEKETPQEWKKPLQVSC